MKILATDLDRTLLPNGNWPPDTGAIDLFNELTQRHDVLVVYVTGRNLDLTENAIREFGIRYPHVLIGDVGTSIRKYGQGGWKPHDGWDTHVKLTSPRWDADAVRSVVAGLDGQAGEIDRPRVEARGRAGFQARDFQPPPRHPG